MLCAAFLVISFVTAKIMSQEKTPVQFRTSEVVVNDSSGC